MEGRKEGERQEGREGIEGCREGEREKGGVRETGRQGERDRLAPIMPFSGLIMLFGDAHHLALLCWNMNLLCSHKNGHKI